MGVGAGHDDELRVGARIDGGLDAVAHFRGAHEFLAGPVAAALGLHLILEMAARRAGAGHFADRARDHEGAAPAGVRIDEQRQRGRLRDAPDVLADIVQRRDAEIGQAERGIGHARAGKIERAKARALREHGAVGVDRAGDLQRPFGFDCGAQPGAG